MTSAPRTDHTGTHIEFRDITKTFRQGRRTTHALNGVSLEVKPGEILGVIGYSGAGKSTLVRMINGLDTPTSGAVLIDGVDITGLSERKLRTVRRGIGMIFQQFNLMNSRTAAANVAYPLALAGVGRAERKRKAQELLEFVGLADKGKNYPDQLSGGQKQRVGIARALATDPRLLLADEATSALDPETTQDVLALLRRVNRELGLTIVVITHEMEVVRSIADNVAVMEAGKVVEYGPVHEVFSNPKTEIAKRFVATALRDTPDGRERESLLDELSSSSDDRLITVRVDDSVDVAAIFAAASAKSVRATVVHGAVNNIQEHSFGRLTLRLSGTADAIEQSITAIAGLTHVEEIKE